MRNEQWLLKITSLYSVRLNNLWMDKIGFEDIYMKFKKTEPVEIS